MVDGSARTRQTSGWLSSGWLSSGWRADAIIVLVITIAVAGVSQRWTGLDTPDSSFYTSLSLYGDQVTDRAVFDSYYWTRLGKIAPTMALTTVLGPWLGFEIYRLLLVLVIVAGVYATLRTFTGSLVSGRALAAVLTTMAALSSVVLSYAGNPYVAGTVLAGTSLIIALGLRDSRRAAVGAGAVLGWLVMVLPPGALLAGCVWLALRIIRWRRAPEPLVHLGVAAGATVVVSAAFVLLGRMLFPGLDWIGTYLEASRMKGSDFASDTPVWMQDISLLVPLGVVVICGIAWLVQRHSTALQVAVVISLSSILALAGISLVLMGGVALEAPMYQAMLWPPALIALALTAVSVPGGWSRVCTVVAALLVAAVFVAGHWAGAMSIGAGRVLTVVAAMLALIGLWSARRFASLALALASVGVVLVAGQLLQNSRGPLGLYYLSPYAWAYNDNPIEVKVRTAVNAQEWLLDNTSAQDRILTWVGGAWVAGDRELYVVAGMQLWGENRVTLEPVVTADDAARLAALRPDVVQMVAPDMQQVIDFWTSLPQQSRPSPPQCYDFTWPVAPSVGHSCLSRLSWTD